MSDWFFKMTFSPKQKLQTWWKQHHGMMNSWWLSPAVLPDISDEFTVWNLCPDYINSYHSREKKLLSSTFASFWWYIWIICIGRVHCFDFYKELWKNNKYWKTIITLKLKTIKKLIKFLENNTINSNLLGKKLFYDLFSDM